MVTLVFVPLSELLLPQSKDQGPRFESPVDQQFMLRHRSVPNFLGCGNPVSWILFGFHLFIYLGFYVAFNTVQVISRGVVGRAEETSTYSWSRFCTVHYQRMASKYRLSHLRSGREPNPGLRGGR